MKAWVRIGVFGALAFGIAARANTPVESLIDALEKLGDNSSALVEIKRQFRPDPPVTDPTLRKAAQIGSDDKYWAFRPVVRPAVPRVSDSSWVANPIDAFVRERLERAGLKPSAPADKRTLIRRMYLDVLGLPPTPEEVDTFLADNAEDAYEQLVDRVLASPHYGERWARHWLDVVRYADSHGFEMNKPRYNAWHYRDYVIRALNEDRPYTQFIMEQLAGDVTGELAATGFLVAGPMDEVKSPDIVLTKMQRDQELHDVTSITAAAFLGLTVGCAKCHEHKFDPISQRDYYALRAVFAGVQHGERDLPDPKRDERLRHAAALREELTAMRAKMLRLARDEQPDGKRRRVSTMENVERFEPVDARFVRMNIAATSDIEPCIDEFEVYTAGENPMNVALTAHGGVATASSEFPDNPKHKTAHLNDGRFGNDYSWIPQSKDSAWVQIELAHVARIDCVAWARDREGNFRDRVITAYTVEVSLDGTSWQTVATSETRQPFDPNSPLPPLYQESLLTAEDAALLKQYQKREGRLRSEIRKLSDGPKIYAALFKHPEPTYLLQRGDPMQDRAFVAAGTPQHVGRLLAMEPAEPESSRRVRLAEWIGNEDNPLTARVMVNRIWQHHFGRGIVDTPSDFGAMGAKPTHPELLDWLADAFMGSGWHMKAVHKLILMSNTYRQSSAPIAEATSVDAESRLLWRFPPRRLDMEPIRDSILYVSGELDLTMGGPGFDVFEPDDSYVHVYIPKTTFTRAEKRRMIYQWKPRVEQDVTFGIFDCPDASQAMPKRNTSTSPLQALSLLNSPFMQEQASSFAERLKHDAGSDIDRQIARAYALALNREPAEDEAARARALIERYGLQAMCRALFNASEFLYLN